MKTLKQLREIYAPNTKDEKKFIDKHKVQKTPDANKNKDEVFTGSNVKSAERQPKHGYNPGQDEKVYEDYVNDRQRKAVWASKNEEKQRRMRKKIREELDLSEMDDAAGGYPVAGNIKKVPPNKPKPIDPKKYDKKQYDDAAGGYPVVKGTTKEETEIEEASAYKKRGIKGDFPSRLDPLEIRQDMKRSVETISKKDPEFNKQFPTKKIMKMFPLKNEEVELHEARRLIKAYTSGDHGAKVYKNEDGEHEVRFFKNGKDLGEGPAYYTNDVGDAHKTAQHYINKMNTQKEEVELDEVSAPGKEDWIKANKQRFIKEYGKEKGLRILYAKAWKMANKDG